MTSCISDLRGLPLWCEKLERIGVVLIGGVASAETRTTTMGHGCQVPMVEASLVVMFLMCATKERKFWRPVWCRLQSKDMSLREKDT